MTLTTFQDERGEVCCVRQLRHILSVSELYDLFQCMSIVSSKGPPAMVMFIPRDETASRLPFIVFLHTLASKAWKDVVCVK